MQTEHDCTTTFRGFRLEYIQTTPDAPTKNKQQFQSVCARMCEDGLGLRRHLAGAPAAWLHLSSATKLAGLAALTG